MDWEFKISVMYDIAKVRLRKTLHHSEGLYSPGVTWSFMAEGESHTNTRVTSQIDDALPNSKQSCTIQAVAGRFHCAFRALPGTELPVPPHPIP